MEDSKIKTLLFQILLGIAYCHERRIIHRDMKPDNILLDDSRTIVKIADFGMARIVHRTPRNYTEHCVTSWYRPPEIILGESAYTAELHAVDMWGLGCILVEMVNLRPAFASDTEFGCMLSIFKALGTPSADHWPQGAALKDFHESFPVWPPQSPAGLLSSAAPVCRDLLDLVCRTLVLDPTRRIGAAEALGHPAFATDESSSSEEEGDDSEPPRDVLELPTEGEAGC